MAGEYTSEEVTAMLETMRTATKDPRTDDLGAFVMFRAGDGFDYTPTSDPEADVTDNEVVGRYTWSHGRLLNINEETGDED